MKKLALAASLLGLSLIGAEYRSALAERAPPDRAPAAPGLAVPPTEELDPAAARASGSLGD